MADTVKPMLVALIQFADEVSKLAQEAHSFKQECLEVKKQTDKLAALLRQAGRVSGLLCERPASRITDEINQVLGNPEEKADAAASLLSLIQDNERNGKLIVEEGGIGALLKLINEADTVEGQEAAAKAMGKLGKDSQRIKHMIQEGVCSVFAKVLKDGASMKAQTMVAWALSELLSNYPDSQDQFAQSGIIRSLVGHLAFETVPDHQNYTVATKAATMTIHSVFSMATKGNNRLTEFHINTKNMGAPSLSALVLKGKEAEDPIVKASMKAEAARALRLLAKNNINTCKSITESKALLCFAMLLEKGKGAVQYNSAMAVMEIAAVAEHNDDLRRSAFKTNSPAAKALVEQLLRIIEQDDPESQLLNRCIRSIGCLSRTFHATETRPIPALVKHLDHKELSVSREAATALTKFACTENYLHIERSKAILEDSSSAPQLVQLVYFGEKKAQIAALILLCYLALHVGDSEALANADALAALKWAFKQINHIQHPVIEILLPEAKSRLELYQFRGHH